MVKVTVVYKHVFIISISVSALQSNDPEWYTALTSVLKNEEAKSLQEVFHLADQRQASLGKDSF